MLSDDDEAPVDAPNWVQVRFDIDTGSLALLAHYLRASSGEVHPTIRRKLADLIDGPTSSTGYRLKLVKHPNIGTKTEGLEKRIERSRDEIKIAFFMAEAGAARKSGYDAGLAATMSRFGFGRSKIKAIWARWKKPATAHALTLRRLRAARVDGEGHDSPTNSDPL